MENKKELTYAQYGAHVLFEQKIIIPKNILPRIKIVWILSIAVGILSGIFKTSFWIAIPCSLVAAVVLTALLFISNFNAAQKFFEKHPERFLLWQELYISRTIARYERMKKSYPTLLKVFEPIPDIGEVGVRDVLFGSSVAYAASFNMKSSFTLEVIKHGFREAEIEYKKTMEYLSENNLPLPLVT